MPSSQWCIPKPEAQSIGPLVSALGIQALTARVLLSRGLADPESAQRFLTPSLDQLHDPFKLAGMGEAVTRLRAAIGDKEKILIYGDYDVDGTVSVVMLKKAIELAGGQVDFHVPHRLKEGYGMRSDVIERAGAMGVTLLISVDTGIRALEAVRGARERGIDVIVTDHHLPEAQLPPLSQSSTPTAAIAPIPIRTSAGRESRLRSCKLCLLRCPGPRKNRHAC